MIRIIALKHDCARGHLLHCSSIYQCLSKISNILYHACVLKFCLYYTISSLINHVCIRYILFIIIFCLLGEASWWWGRIKEDGFAQMVSLTAQGMVWSVWMKTTFINLDVYTWLYMPIYTSDVYITAKTLIQWKCRGLLLLGSSHAMCQFAVYKCKTCCEAVTKNHIVI